MNPSNPYLSMSIERVRQDAATGVTLARRALAEREPERARAMGIGTEQSARTIQAMRDFFGSPRACKKRRSRVRRTTVA